MTRKRICLPSKSNLSNEVHVEDGSQDENSSPQTTRSLPQKRADSDHGSTAYEKALLATMTVCFFVADKSHGVVPVKTNTCDTAENFFREAGQAMSTLEGNSKQQNIAKLKVTGAALSFPILMMWNSVVGFEMMKKRLIAEGRPGMDISVECILEAK